MSLKIITVKVITMSSKMVYFFIVFPLGEFGLSLVSPQYQINSLLSLQETAAACCEAICNTVIKEEDEWRMSRTRIFLRVKTTYNSKHAGPQLFSIVLTQK